MAAIWYYFNSGVRRITATASLVFDTTATGSMFVDTGPRDQPPNETEVPPGPIVAPETVNANVWHILQSLTKDDNRFEVDTPTMTLSLVAPASPTSAEFVFDTTKQIAAGTGALTANVAFVFDTVTVDLEGDGALTANAAFVFDTIAVDLEGDGGIAANVAFVFDTSKQIAAGVGGLSASPAFVFDAQKSLLLQTLTANVAFVFDIIAASPTRPLLNRHTISRRVTLTLQEGDQIRIMRERLAGSASLESTQHGCGIVFVGPIKLDDDSG